MDDIIARIKQKLAYLQQHDDGDVTEASRDREWQIKSRYPYSVHTRHSEEEIAAFEAKNEIQLPTDYRRFIKEVGSRGFNPGYTMFSPIKDTITYEEAIVLVDDSDGRNLTVIGALKQPFPFRDSMTYMAIEHYRTEHDLPLDDDSWRLNGYLEISFAGCICWYILIVSGETRGQIWYQDSFFSPVMLLDGELFVAHSDPVREGQAQRLTFTQWYEAWLNKQISIAQEHWQKRGRTVPQLVLNDD